MLIEALEATITYRWPGGSITLNPHEPVEVEELRALRHLTKAGGKVRVSNEEWLRLWRQVAVLTNDITKENRSFQELIAVLNCCDAAFIRGDVCMFKTEVSRISSLVEENGLRR